MTTLDIGYSEGSAHCLDRGAYELLNIMVNVSLFRKAHSVHQV